MQWTVPFCWITFFVWSSTRDHADSMEQALLDVAVIQYMLLFLNLCIVLRLMPAYLPTGTQRRYTSLVPHAAQEGGVVERWIQQMESHAAAHLSGPELWAPIAIPSRAFDDFLAHRTLSSPEIQSGIQRYVCISGDGDSARTMGADQVTIPTVVMAAVIGILSTSDRRLARIIPRVWGYLVPLAFALVPMVARFSVIGQNALGSTVSASITYAGCFFCELICLCVFYYGTWNVGGFYTRYTAFRGLIAA
jgi:hypothetical protein